MWLGEYWLLTLTSFNSTLSFGGVGLTQNSSPFLLLILKIGKREIKHFTVVYIRSKTFLQSILHLQVGMYPAVTKCFLFVTLHDILRNPFTFGIITAIWGNHSWITCHRRERERERDCYYSFLHIKIRKLTQEAFVDVVSLLYGLMYFKINWLLINIGLHFRLVTKNLDPTWTRQTEVVNAFKYYVVYSSCQFTGCTKHLKLYTECFEQNFILLVVVVVCRDRVATYYNDFAYLTWVYQMFVPKKNWYWWYVK